MLFRVVSKDAFTRFVESLQKSVEVVGPKQIGVDKDGKPIHHFLPIERFEDLDLAYEKCQYSAKAYFLPHRTRLSTFKMTDNDWEQSIKYAGRSRAIIGLHACDINALLKLDKVFARDFYPNPYYISRRRNMFVVGIDHPPCDNGFCHAINANDVTHGFDLFLTDLGDRYFVKINSDRAFMALNEVPNREITKADTGDYLAVRKSITDAYQFRMKTEDLPNLLDIEFESDVWKKWGSKCLSCGTCAQVCPTCYCYGITERVAMDHSEGAKISYLYSCNLLDFAVVAGGHNFRPAKETRLKYRYYHQHRGFVETYGEPLCVGCNRCGKSCLSGINPIDVIHDLQEEGKR
jgi:formate hydrogenlyase subunit 6/NADH:ubiquinone oxidoreductase subunit I